MKFKMLHTHVLRCLGFEMHFTIICHIQIHTQQTQKKCAWRQVCRLRKVILSLAGALGPWAIFVHKCRHISGVTETLLLFSHRLVSG